MFREVWAGVEVGGNGGGAGFFSWGVFPPCFPCAEWG